MFSSKKFPWVCNGCKKVQRCHLNKYFYYSDIANNEYKEKLVSSREGINLTEDEFKILDHTVSEYVKSGQPIFIYYHLILYPLVKELFITILKKVI